jgi:hypothetical protein
MTQATTPSPTPEELEAIKAWKRQQQSQTRVDRVSNILSGIDPWILIGIAGLVLVMWAIGTITQIRTSEALMLHGQRVPVDVQWGVLLQVPQLLTNTAPIDASMGWIYGWGIETLTLIWGLVLEHAKASLFATNKFLATIFGSTTVLLIGVNGWADYASSPGNDMLQQGLIAGVVAIIVTTFLPIGIGLLRAGVANLNKKVV